MQYEITKVSVWNSGLSCADAVYTHWLMKTLQQYTFKQIGNDKCSMRQKLQWIAIFARCCCAEQQACFNCNGSTGCTRVIYIDLRMVRNQKMWNTWKVIDLIKYKEKVHKIHTNAPGWFLRRAIAKIPWHFLQMHTVELEIFTLQQTNWIRFCFRTFLHRFALIKQVFRPAAGYELPLSIVLRCSFCPCPKKCSGRFFQPSCPCIFFTRDT